MPINQSGVNGVYVVMQVVGIEKIIILAIFLTLIVIWLRIDIERSKREGLKREMYTMRKR